MMENQNDSNSNSNNFTSQMDEIRKIRQAKFSNKFEQSKPKPTYNYELRKDTLEWIKKCSRIEVMKERMDRIEKTEYANKISKIQLEDLEYFKPNELNENFMIDLFKYSYSIQVLQKAFDIYKQSLNNPHILMIKELLLKPNVPEDFLIELLEKYTNSNLSSSSNVLSIIITTNLLETKNFLNAKNYIMEMFYSNPNITISFEQLKMIYSNTLVNPTQLKILIQKCTNITGYSKCSKSHIERPNKDLIKNIIRETEQQFKCKIDIDLYN